MPPVEPYADMIGTLTLREMEAKQVRAKRIEEALIAHLLDNGHAVRIPMGRMVQATSKHRSYRLVCELDEEAAEYVWTVVDNQGRPVIQPKPSSEARTSGPGKRSDTPPET